MKKYLIVLLLTLLCILIFTGCSNDLPPDSQDKFRSENDNETQTVSENNSNRPVSSNPDCNWGVKLSAENVTSKGLTIVCVQSGGEPAGELQTGASFSIETEIDGQWNEAKMLLDEVYWNAIAWLVPMNDSVEWDVDWEYLYGKLPVGKYRICKEIMDCRGTGNYDECTFYAYFEIKD